MGIIKSQGFKHSLVNYLATIVAALSVILVYPHSEGSYGLAGFLIAAASIIAPFASLGANSITIRFFPHFHNKEQKHYGFLSLIVSYAAISLVVLGGLGIYFKTNLIDFLASVGFDAHLFENYTAQIYALTVLIVLINILSTYISNFGRITIAAVYNNLLFKLTLPILVILFISGTIQINTFSWSIIGVYLIGLIGLLIYLKQFDEISTKPDLDFLKPKLIRQMGVYALFGILGSLGSTLTLQIDRLMVPALIDLRQADIYNVALFIGASIELPARSVIAITSPIIAKAWFQKDLETLRQVYHKSSINLFIIGVLFFLGIWLCLEDIFQLSGKYESLLAGKWVVFCVGVTKLLDMATSVNGQIIGYSRYFRFNLVVILILGGGNAFLNYYFIQIRGTGILGPAIATLISVSIYNLLRVGFIWYRFKMQPFSKNNFAVLAVGIAIFYIIDFIPNFDLPILNILKNSSLVVLLFIPLIYFCKVSSEFNDLVTSILLRINPIKRK